MVNQASGGGSSSSGTSESTDSNATTTTTEDASYEINLEDTEALLIQQTAVSSFVTIDDADPGTSFLAGGGSTTNFWKMDSLGEIRPAIERELSSSQTSSYTGAMVTVNAERIDVSPTGIVYVLLSSPIRIGGVLCKWVAVNPHTVSNTTNVSSCAEDDTSFDINRVVFDSFGDVYYSNTYNEINFRDVGSGVNVTIFKGKDIGFQIGDFIPAPDESLILLGVLDGTVQHLFRYYPEIIFGTTKMESLPLGGMVSWDKQFILDNDANIFYSNAGEVYKITFTYDDKAVFSQPTEDIYGYQFTRDSHGDVYAVGDVRYDNNWNTITILSDPSYESIEMSLKQSDIFEVKGDYMFATGKDGAGKKVFLRKHILGDQDEVDLLNGRDMLVQSFDVKENGDVYFGALDYTTVKRGMFLYHNNTGVIDNVLEIPNDLKTILYLP